MNPLKNISWFLFCISLVLTLSSGVASACGSLPSAQSSLTLYCIPITVAASSATSNAQVMLTLPASTYSTYLAGSLQNIYVYNSISGTTTPAWIEGNVLNEGQTTNLNTVANVIIWINDPNANIISTSADTNYYIGIGSTSTNFFIAGNNIGEAPQLSSTYAQYDNGNVVFIGYDNYIGTTLSTTAFGGYAACTGYSEPTISVNNGVTFTASGCINTVNTYSGIAEIYGSITPGTGTADCFGYLPPTKMCYGWYSAQGLIGDTQAVAADSGYTFGTKAVISVYLNGGVGNSNINYQDLITQSTGVPAYPLNFGWWPGNGNAADFAQWARERVIPPGGVMPATTFGAVQSTSTASISYSSNPITYGASTIVTCQASPNTDTVDCDLPLGTHFCTGIGSCSYSISQPAAGSYNWCSNDLTSAITSCLGLTVNQATQQITCTYNTYPITSGQNVNSLLASANIICSNPTVPSNYLTNSYLKYNGITEGTSNTVIYNAVWNNLLNTGNFIAPGDGNYIANSLPFTINDLIYTINSLTLPSTPFYETQTKTFSYSLNLTKAASWGNVILNDNSIYFSNLTANVLSGPQTFSLTYPVQLAPANNILHDFNGILQVYWTAQAKVLNAGTFNTLTENTLWNYIPSPADASANIILGSSQTVYMNITDVNNLNKATVTNALLTIGTQTMNYQTLINYKYYYAITSFLPSTFGLTTPQLNLPYNVPTNSEIQLTWASNSVWRNTTNSFGSFYPDLVPCNSINPQAINYTFYETNDLSVVTANVGLTGYYVIKNNLYSSNTIPGTTAGLSSSATSNSYRTCIYPSWAKFQTWGGFNYSGSGYVQSFYYLIKQATSTVTSFIHLYLTPTFTNIAEYDIAVENLSTTSYIPAYIQVNYYIGNTNTTIIADEFQTASASGYTIDLQNGARYSFSVYSLSGTFLTQTGILQASCGSSSVCTYIIPISNSNAPQFASFIGGIKYICSASTLPFNQSTISCTITSVNGTSLIGGLQVWNQTPVNNKIVCNKWLQSASMSFSCLVTNTNTTIYNYYLRLNSSIYGLVTLTQGSIGTKIYSFGSMGLFFSLIALIMGAMAFIFITPTAGVVVVDALLLLLDIMGLIALSTTTIGGLMIFSAVMIYALNKGGSG